MSRDYNREAKDSAEQKYAYQFDYVMRRYMMRTLAPACVAGNALEMGCFEGEMTSLLAAQFSDLTVIEAGSELIARARQRVPASVRFIHSTFEQANPATPFHNIFLVHTLEHLDDPVAVLSRVRQWLHPGGRLLVVVPNADAASRQIAVKMGLISHNNAVTAAEAEHGHRITYSFDTLERDVRAAGFHVHQRGGIFFKPFANAQFDRLLQTDIITPAYLEGCYQLGMQYPELCASIYLVCSHPVPQQ
ncbi:class I SAM-dependent methyltransferase [Permianibacter sp. IMCC34836]|uniref:class I SAM-dependent methyltransferase n=1 Tax=Permianibacter fluminis TaxID=2738515 RepID=UPI0015557287|nr:class I SAM-dependent methyltransferase [Permianibacter fluminis]NQD38060.1 class I SAM-dependent methyltransferase [Permianibacter fluminis]